MSLTILDRIKQYLIANTPEHQFAPIEEGALRDVESAIGLSLPDLLRQCYFEIGNGGFGPGYGVIGIGNGYRSDYGDLVETYRTLKEGHEQDRQLWPQSVIPFSEWGCNIFSCVDCMTTQIHTFDESSIWPEQYGLEHFFELWMQGVDILSNRDACEMLEIKIANPFTGKSQTIRQKRRR